MHTRFRNAAFVTCLAWSLPGVGAAQSANVTFEVPLNLTRLPSEIVSVQVICTIDSFGLPGQIQNGQLQPGRRAAQSGEIPVTNGRLVTTLTLVAWIASAELVNPVGKTADYRCQLIGITNVDAQDFEQNHSNPVFRMTPTPVVTGSFSW